MEKIKILIVILLLLAAAWFAYQYLIADSAELKLGNEVNAQTFLSIFGKEDKVYLVMDVRNVTEQKTKTNILQCGVDFAASNGLVTKNLTFYSFDDKQGCVALEGIFPLEYCMNKINEDGITIYVQEGNSSKFYTNALVVGVGTDYAEGKCSIRMK
jgi:hypothetical protein